MYILLNQDGTVNYADDHPINPNLSFEDVVLFEYPELTMSDVVDPHLTNPMHAVWDPESRRLIEDPEFKDYYETLWLRRKVKVVKEKIANINMRKDLGAPYPTDAERLPYLLNDYHSLVQYSKSEPMRFSNRPTLSIRDKSRPVV